MQHAHQRALLKAALNAKHTPGQQAAAFVQQGLGRTRIAKTAEKDGASTLTLKVRRGAHKKKEAKEPLAEEEDDG